MKRSCFTVLVLCALLLVSPAVLAVDVPSLITKAESALESVTEPAPRAEILLALLVLDEAVGNTDKATGHFAALQHLVAEATDLEFKSELIAAAAEAAIGRRDYSAAFALVNQISDESRQLRGSVLLAGQVLADGEHSDFNPAPVLESLLPRLAPHPDLAAVVHAFLGKCYAKQGNSVAATASFSESVKLAKTLESLEEQHVLGMVVTLQVAAGMRDAAVELATSQPLPTTAQYLLGMIAMSEIKSSEALPWEKTLAMITDTEISEAVRGVAVESLVESGRLAEATKIAASTSEDVVRDTVSVAAVEALVRAKDWDAALTRCQTISDLETRGRVLAGMVVAQYRAGNDAGCQKTLALLQTPASIARSKELRESVAIAAKANDPQSVRSRVNDLGNLFSQQFVLGDVEPSRATLDAILAALPLDDDPMWRLTVFTQSQMMRLSLLRQEDILPAAMEVVAALVAFEGVEPMARLNTLGLCTETLAGLVTPGDATTPLEAATGIADTLADPHQRAFAYVRIAQVQASLAKAQQESQKQKTE